MKCLVLVSAVLISCLCFPFMGYSSDLKVVFATGEWPPYTSEKMPGYGYVTEVVTAACDAVGIEPKYQFYPWLRAEVMVKRGMVFAAFPYMKTTDRQQEYLMSESLLEATNHFVYYNKNPRTLKEIKYEKIEDIKDYTIGVIRGDTFAKEMVDRGMKIIASNSPDLCIKMLKNGRTDFYIGERISIISMVKRLYPQEVTNFQFLPHIYGGKKENGLIVSKVFPNAESILHLFNEGLKIIKENGEYDKIRTKHIH